MEQSKKRRPGRPAKAIGTGVSVNRGVRFYPEDAARLQRLSVRLRRGESEVIRHALAELERASDAAAIERSASTARIIDDDDGWAAVVDLPDLGCVAWNACGYSGKAPTVEEAHSRCKLVRALHHAAKAVEDLPHT